MKTHYIPPKYRVVLYFFITVVGMIALAYIYFVQPVAVRSLPSSAATSVDPQVEKTNSAKSFIDSYADQFEYVGNPQTEAGSKLFPEEAGVSKRLESVSTSEFDVASAGIIVTQSPKKSQLYFDGMKVARNEKLPNGLKIKDYGQFFVVLEDESGAMRRIELNDRFVADLKNRKTEVKK